MLCWGRPEDSNAVQSLCERTSEHSCGVKTELELAGKRSHVMKMLLRR